MKILSAEQTRQLDAYTIEHEPISSLDLMERASRAFSHWFRERYPDEDRPLVIFCGPGNNGGDGLAVARLLHEAAYQVRVVRCMIGNAISPDNQANLARLEEKRVIEIIRLNPGDPWPDLPARAVIIDAIFGSGLSRPVEGYWAELLRHLNELPAERVAIDIPSGVFPESHTTGATFHAHRTLSFELPKLAFFMPENGEAVGRWEVRPIGLSGEHMRQLDTPYHFMDADLLRPLLRARGRFEHKGTFGHALIIAGSYGKMGACVLCSRAALRAGAGLVTVHAPRTGYEILQIALPEAMVIVDQHRYAFSEIEDVDKYDVVGVGPGLGTNEVTGHALRELLRLYRKPMVVDADALNLLARHPELLPQLPKDSVLTPHPKEFERLFGATENDFERLELQRRKARELGVYVVLKTGATSIATPSGEVYINGTGNPGMGTAGTGDVLTGILTGLMAQPYSVLDAVRLGVYLHGLAGDLAAEELEQECLIAEDVISHLGKAFRGLRRSGVQ